MNIKKISAIVAGVALACGLSVPASAVTLTAGDLKITINAYDSGTVGYGNTTGIKCTTTAGCDAAGTNPAPNAYGGEDTWGIFSVQSISRVSNGSLLFTAGQNGEYLTGMFGGITDTYVEVSGISHPKHHRVRHRRLAEHVPDQRQLQQLRRSRRPPRPVRLCRHHRRRRHPGAVGQLWRRRRCRRTQPAPTFRASRTRRSPATARVTSTSPAAR